MEDRRAEVAGGTLQVGNGSTGSLGTGAVTNNAALVFNRSNSAEFANAISGTGAVMQANATGTTILSGVNSYSGGTTVTSGTLALSGAGTLGATTGVLAVNGGTLDLGATSQTVGAVSFGGSW